MKKDKVIWGGIALLVLFTFGVSSGSFLSSGQEPAVKMSSNTPVPVSQDDRDLSGFGSVDFVSGANVTANEKRWLINKRYDNLEWVLSTITNPETAGVGRITDDPPPPPFPIGDSSLIIVGEVVAVKTFLSNNRRGVYTEFEIKINEFLKGDGAQKTIVADREGGVVIYPNGQRVLYQSSQRALPKLGSQYLFFLNQRADGLNYDIITSYSLEDSRMYQLEDVTSFQQLKGKNKSQFLGELRSKIAEFQKK
jgi:hypothetical protein